MVYTFRSRLIHILYTGCAKIKKNNSGAKRLKMIVNNINNKNKPFIIYYILLYYIIFITGLGGLGVVCWPLVPTFAGSNPAETVGLLGRKNLQQAFLLRGSKAVRSHVVDLRHVKDP